MCAKDTDTPANNPMIFWWKDGSKAPIVISCRGHKNYRETKTNIPNNHKNRSFIRISVLQTSTVFKLCLKNLVYSEFNTKYINDLLQLQA